MVKNSIQQARSPALGTDSGLDNELGIAPRVAVGPTYLISQSPWLVLVSKFFGVSSQTSPSFLAAAGAHHARRESSESNCQRIAIQCNGGGYRTATRSEMPVHSASELQRHGCFAMKASA